MYTEHEVKISAGEKKRLEAKLRQGRERGGLTQKTLTIKAINDNGDGGGGGGEKVMLLLTRQQIARLQKARSPATIIKMRKRQILANMKVEGGFLGMLAGLAARALPTLLTGLASGVLSGVVENAITSKKSKTNGNGVYIQKGKHCYRADPVKGGGLFLSRAAHRYPRHTDGIYVQDGPKVQRTGKGILFGKNSPFRNIPILGWLL